MFLSLILLFVIMLLLLVFIAGSITILFSDFFLDLPYLGANKIKIETIIKFASLKKGEVVIDLGSGDGRLLIPCAKKGAVAIGYELNPLLYWLSKFKTHGVSKNVIIKRESFWQANLKSADVVFVYSLRKYMQKFEEFIEKNAKKGTRVIVNTNPFPHKKPIKSESGIFFYKV